MYNLFMKFFKIFLHLLWIVFLTITTQVGGLIWIFSILIASKLKKKKQIVFPLVYLIFNLLIVPPIASFFGREKLPVFSDSIKSHNIAYSLLFRNYVSKKLKTVLINSSQSLVKEDIIITYLDANFPFINGFPLLPHRSHNDGNKIDISFMYKTNEGVSTRKKPSLSGYGKYVKDENYTSNNCLKKGYWQYDFSKYLTFGIINDLTFDNSKTKKIITTFLSQKNIDKIFIEPYLKENLGLTNYSKIRFHGCKAVRHDDHIHLQIK